MIKTLDFDVAAWPCDAVIEHIFEFLDGELPGEADAAVREHITHCIGCLGLVRRDQLFLDFLARRARHVPAPPALRARVAELLAREMKPRRLS
jgi:mycothiol system anti-sigma-R factor